MKAKGKATTAGVPRIQEEPRVCVVGCGYWGKNLARNFFALGALAEVCDADEQGRETAAGLCPGVRISSSLADVLEGGSSALAIATPAGTHYRLARQALQAGKDVFVEKPLALTVAEGSELVQLAERDSRILMVGHVLEYHPAVRILTNLVQTGELGRLQYIYSNRLSLGKIRPEENILWSFAPHDIAVILRLVGSMPRKVTACGGTYVQANVADVTVTNLAFENGVRAPTFTCHGCTLSRSSVWSSLVRKGWPRSMTSTRNFCSMTGGLSGIMGNLIPYEARAGGSISLRPSLFSSSAGLSWTRC